MQLLTAYIGSVVTRS